MFPVYAFPKYTSMNLLSMCLQTRIYPHQNNSFIYRLVCLGLYVYRSGLA